MERLDKLKQKSGDSAIQAVVKQPKTAISQMSVKQASDPHTGVSRHKNRDSDGFRLKNLETPLGCGINIYQSSA